MNEPALRCAMCGAFWTNHHLCPGPRAPMWQHDNGRDSQIAALRAKLAAAEAVVEVARPVTHAQATVYARNQHFKAKELALHYNGLAIAIQRAIEKWDALSPKGGQP